MTCSFLLDALQAPAQALSKAQEKHMAAACRTWRQCPNMAAACVLYYDCLFRPPVRTKLVHMQLAACLLPENKPRA